MKLLYWNCQGLGRPLTIRALRELIKYHRPSVDFLSETENTTEFLELWRRRMGFQFSYYVPPTGIAGGLALWWKDVVKISIIGSSPNYIHTYCYSEDRGMEWFSTFVYGSPYRGDKEAVLLELSSLNPRNNKAWVCGGDFNIIRNTWEKIGGQQADPYQMRLFDGWINGNDLIDLEAKGPTFTWYNRREDHHSVAQRLDRILSNAEWRLMYGEAQVFHEGLIGSDHRPLILDLEVTRRRRIKRFQFECKWVEAQEWIQVVRNSWGNLEGNGDLNAISQNLIRCASNLRKWHYSTVGNTGKRIAKLKQQLEDLKSLPFTSEVKTNESILLEELELLWKMEEKHWLQRSRITWLQHGDRNSKFFHAIAVQRNQRNRILRLKDQWGRWIEGDDEIKAVIRDFYINLFNSHTHADYEQVLSKIPRSITEEMNLALTSPVSDEEIRLAVFSMGALKAPGPDGFSGMFYQKAWTDIGPSICAAIKNFFQTGIMPTKLNKTNIVLIPKVSMPSQVSQFRPISLCNFLYKIISKVIVLRLKPWMPVLIHSCQSAFIPNRMIQDNILIMHELTNIFKRASSKKAFNFAIKVDIFKAYDSVSWSFLVQTLQRMGFANTFVNWIWQCVSTVSYSILVNGEATQEFRPARGLRQRDPLSPYLFLLVSNCLSFLIEDAVLNGQLHGVKLSPRSPCLSHILFADDTVILGKASMEEVQQLKLILKQYEKASGQCMNPSKSSILFSQNTPNYIRDQISGFLGMKEMVGSKKYLGMPTQWGKSKSQSLSFLVNRVEQRAQSWKHKLLSMGGREIMTKAVLTAIPLYILSCFRVPQGICKKLDRILSNFWWGKFNNGKGIVFEKWQQLTKAKGKGGMGFRCFNCFNLALVAKQAWRLISNPQCLWARLMKSLYFPHTDFWNAEKGSKASWGWSSLLEVRDVLKKGARLNIGNGRQTLFWTDPWVPDLRGFKIYSPQPRNDGALRVKDWITVNGEWDITKLQEHLSPQEVRAVLRVPIGSSQYDDKWVWHQDKQGKFTVKHVYHMVHQTEELSLNIHHPSSSLSLPDSLWKYIWKLKIPSKVNVFLWRACKNNLPTKDQLFKRKLVEQPLCDLCHQATETVEHALLLCDHARASWHGSHLNIIINSSHVSSFAAWWNSLLEKVHRDKIPEAASHMAFLCWHIWKSRNQLIFKRRPPDPGKSIQLAAQQTNEFLAVWKPKSQSYKQVVQDSLYLNRWHPPPKGKYKINVDASFDFCSQTAALALICRSYDGQMIDGAVEKASSFSPLAAEAEALKFSLSFAINKGWSECIFESDSKLLVDVCNNTEDEPPWEISATVSVIRGFIPSFKSIIIRWVSRDSNKIADWVASQMAKDCLPTNWLYDKPLRLIQFLYADLSALLPLL